MSRHRIIKGLNLDDELDDQAIDSGGEGEEEWDDMDQDQQVQMSSALSQIHSILGPNTPIKERDIKEALWNYFFDVESSIGYLLEEQHKKEANKSKTSEPSITSTTTTATPLDTPLAALSLQPISIPTAPPMSKLAAKMAAAKLAKAKEVESASISTDIVPEKKLSKLQLKMLASQAAKNNKPVSTSISTSTSIPLPTPIILSIEPLPFIPKPVEVELPSLLALPSSFASTLSPTNACTKSSSFNFKSKSKNSTKSLVKRIESTLIRTSAISSREEGISAFEGPSPDDIVFNARKGNVLASGVVPKRK